MNRLKLLCAALVMSCAVGADQVRAQGYPPMDMSWAMPWMTGLQIQGDQAAHLAALQYLAWAQQYRAMTGYTGPLPSPVSPQALERSIQGANAAAQRYIYGAQVNSARTSNAVQDWSYRATLACHFDMYLHRYVCPYGAW